MKSNRIFWLLFIGVFFLGFTHNGFAENYPNKPIRIIVPFAAGGSNDIMARALQKPLGKELKVAIVVENFPGGSTKQGTMELLGSDPDGYSVMLAVPTALMGYYYSGTYNEKVWEKMAIIGQSGVTPAGLIEVKADSPFKTWADLASYAKKNPGKLTCGGPGAGGLMGFIAQETAKGAGIIIKYVPFAGAGPSGTALLGGHVDYRVCVLVEGIVNIHAGVTRGLAISYYERVPELPDVPTFQELNITDVSYLFPLVLLGPAKLPANIVDILAKALEKAVKDPEYMELARKFAFQPIFRDGQYIRSFVKTFDEKVGPKLAAFYKK